MVTGIVGVAGIVGTFLGTWLQRRQQLQELRLKRSHEIQNMLREERKSVYGRFLKLSNEVVRLDTEIIGDLYVRYTGLLSDSEIQEFNNLLARRKEVFWELRTVEGNLLLLAKKQVRTAAGDFISTLMKSWRWTKDYMLYAGAELPERLERLSSSGNVIEAVMKAKEDLVLAMRADLAEVQEQVLRTNGTA